MVRDKLEALNILLNCKNYQKAFSEVGANWQLSCELFSTLEKFMYVNYTDISKVNEKRYELFRARGRKVETGQPPPC